MSKHLDLGCGTRPRNPYAREEVFGVDLRGDDERIRRANLVIDPIPFADASFDSVSAYDFLEHVPRVLATADGRATRFPFVDLMNEIWRVLLPGGLLYAITPVYPHKAAFQDPTHVNILTADTHHYFVRPLRGAEMYGFKGDFLARRVQLDNALASVDFLGAPQGILQTWRQRVRTWRGACSHVVWEFEAVK